MSDLGPVGFGGNYVDSPGYQEMMKKLQKKEQEGAEPVNPDLFKAKTQQKTESMKELHTQVPPHGGIDMQELHKKAAEMESEINKLLH